MTRTIVTKNGYAATAEEARALRVLNPYVVVWLRVHGLAHREIFREPGTPPDADSLRVTIAGESLPWGVHYSEWITRQWEAWARSLGFTKCSPGTPTLARTAMLHGHGSHEFGPWLERAYPLVKACKCGRCYTLSAWQLLPFVGKQGSGELRNCLCGSTLMIDEEK